MSLAQQIVQASHASYEAGRYANPDGEIPHLVLCEADSEVTLRGEIERLEFFKIPYIIFREPDIGDQITAIATLPIPSQQQKKLAGWKLWH